MALFAKVTIDEDLKKQLLKRGLVGKLNELESTKASNKGSELFKKELQKTTTPVAKFVAPLGESVGSSMAAVEATMLQKKTLERTMVNADNVLKVLKDPNIDKEYKTRLVRVFAKENPDIISSNDYLQETIGETLGKAGTTALNAALALSVAGTLQATGTVSRSIISGNQAINKIGTGKNAIPLAKIAGKTLRGGRSFLGGSLWGTSMALESGKTKPSEIAKDAIILGTFNLVAPAIAGKLLKTGFKVTENIGSLSKKTVETVVNKASKITKNTKKSSNNFLIETALPKKSNITQTLAGYVEKSGQALLDFPSKVKTEMIDRLAPIQKFVNKVQGKYPDNSIQLTGRDTYMLARNYAGINGKFTVVKNDFDNLLKNYNGIENEVLGYAKGLDLMTRAQKGQAVEQGKTLEQLNQALLNIEDRVRQKLGETGIVKLRQGITEYNNFMKEKLLNEYVESGIVSKEIADKWVKENPNYVPHDVFDFVEDMGVKTFTGEGGGFNVLDSGIKAAKGSVRDLVNVYDSVLHRIGQAQRIAERNKVAKSLIELAENDLDYFGFQKITPNNNISVETLEKQGLQKISFFREGIKEDWIVPKDLGNAMKNLDAKQIGLLGKFIGYPAKVLRNFATRFNLSFTLTNFPRDLQTAVGINENGLTKKNLVYALNEVGNLNNPKTRAFFEGGGAFGGLVGVEKASREVTAATNRAPIFNSVKKVGEIVESVGERFENGTRFAVYLNDIERGVPHEKAIFHARNATVDFAKMGNTMSVLNNVIPFLNARTQGLTNVVTSITKDPTKFIRRQFYQAVYPTMMLYAHNTQFDSYKNIPSYERENYWLFMINEHEGFDDQGNKTMIPEYIKIKKGEVQQATSNIVENYFLLSEDENPKNTKEFLLSLLENTSPINTGSFGPLTIPLELESNYDLFRGNNIEPDYQEIVEGGKKLNREDVPSELRQTRYTSETAKAISKNGGVKFGLSPARVEFIINKLFAGTGKDILYILDATQSSVNQSEDNKDKDALEKFSKLPVLRTFIGTNAAGEKMMLYDIVSQVNKEKIVPYEIERELEADSYVDMLNGLKEQGKTEELKQIWSDLDDDMKTRVKRIKNNRTDGGNTVTNIYSHLTSNNEKLLYLIEVFNKIDTKEGKKELWQDLTNQKLLTDDMKKLLNKAIKNGKIKME